MPVTLTRYKTVPELKKSLKALGLSQAGLRDELVERLSKAQKRTKKRRREVYEDISAPNLFTGQVEQKQQTRAPKKSRMVFIGKPGCGKSFLCNSLIGKAKFTSGKSHDGQGVTQQVQEYTIRNQGRELTIVDTPGLTEYGEMKRMGKEISKAIIPGLNTTLCFVGELPAGRLDDLFLKTIQLVMKSFDEKHPFVVIFNQCGPEVMKNHGAIQAKHSQLFMQCMGLDAPRYYYIPMHNAHYGRNNQILQGDERKDVENVSIYSKESRIGGLKIDVHIAKHIFSDIMDDDFDKSLEEFKGEEANIMPPFHPFSRGCCPPEKRIQFNNNPKAHCQHCSWYAVMKSRRVLEKKCSKKDPGEDCFYCANS